MNRDDERMMEKLHSIAQQIEPAGAFRLSLERELRTRHEQLRREAKPKMTIYLRRLTTIAAALVLLLAVILLVPPFRSLAQDIIDSLFTRADSNEKTQSYPTITDPEILKAEAYYATLLTIEETEELAGFDLKVPENVPSAYVFRGVSYTSVYHTSTLIYSLAGRGLEISQRPLEVVDQRQSEWPVGADADILEVEIGPFKGEYVEGTWIVKSGDLDVDKSTGMTTEKATWLADAPFRRLRWTDDSFLYEMRAMGGSEGHGRLGQEEMIDIAVSMEESETTDEEEVSDVMTIEEAEALGGYDLKVPSHLPEGFVFSGVGYFPQSVGMTLFYSFPDTGKGLLISQQPATDAGRQDSDIGADATVVTVDLGEVTGEYVEGEWTPSKPPDPNNFTGAAKFTWNTDAPDRRLRWIQDEMFYEIRAAGGGTSSQIISQQEMIDIALSMQ